MLVGSGEETDKVLAGLQVAPHHLTLTRQGDPGDWRSVRWSLLPHHPHTFLNTARLQAGVAVPLTAGDIIGVGCPDRSSSRDGRNFTFVYKLNPPEARAETDLTSLSDLLQLSKSLPGRSPSVGSLRSSSTFSHFRYFSKDSLSHRGISFRVRLKDG